MEKETERTKQKLTKKLAAIPLFKEYKSLQCNYFKKKNPAFLPGDKGF